MNITVRQAILADVEIITPLFDGYRQFYRKSSNLPFASAFIRERLANKESVIFIAEDSNGSAVGFTQLYPSFSSVSARQIWILSDLFVLPSARGQRVGRTLLDAAKEHAIGTGAKGLELSTAQDNPAQKLYEAAGYKRDEIFYYYSLIVD